MMSAGGSAWDKHSNQMNVKYSLSPMMPIYHQLTEGRTTCDGRESHRIFPHAVITERSWALVLMIMHTNYLALFGYIERLNAAAISPDTECSLRSGGSVLGLCIPGAFFIYGFYLENDGNICHSKAIAVKRNIISRAEPWY
jgi:hypothetical protein